MDDVTKALLRTDFASFIHKVFTTVDPAANYLYNWHIGLIAEYLLACQRGEIKRLIINIPPRHLKSISVNVAFPAWLLGHNPSAQIMSASYAMELSEEHSIHTRRVMESEWYTELFPKTIIKRGLSDKNTQHKFVTTEQGYRIALSVGGATTGLGGNILIVDDPHNVKQAESDIQRLNACNWFDKAFSTRLNDKKNGIIIVIMQRLHVNDLTGHLLKKGGWELLKLPLIAEENEVLQKGLIRVERKIGDLLHEARMGKTEIDIQKRDLGHDFIGQYQQRPSPEGGGKFKKDWIQYYDNIAIGSLNKYMLIDSAYTQNENSDYTAIWIIGAGADNNLYIVDLIRDRLTLKGRIDAIIGLHKKYQPLNVGYQVAGNEVDQVQAIRMEMERINYRFPIQEVKINKSIGSKLIRIDRLEPLFANKRIYFPRHIYKTDYLGKMRELVDEFIHQEYEPYPVGAHDDMMDSLSTLFDIPIMYPNTKIDGNYERYLERGY